MQVPWNQEQSTQKGWADCSQCTIQPLLCMQSSLNMTSELKFALVHTNNGICTVRLIIKIPWIIVDFVFISQTVVPVMIIVMQ